jgi:4-amino-4-deoxy-L-arabinose transferase-like glycosyltransferase
VLTKTPQGYYGMLTEALLEAHLHLNRVPDPGLLALPDPYDNLANRIYRLTDATHDLSLYRGRFYLYFGAAPAVVFFAPFRLITGRYLPENLVLALLMIATFLISLSIVRRLAAELPRPGTLVDLLVVALLGLCNFAPFLLRRPRTYEVAIAAGAFFALLGVNALSRGLRPKAGIRWLAFSGAAFGLAFASRPTQGLGAALMFVASVLLFRRDGRAGLRGIAALWSPWLMVVGLVLLYNQARFDDALEFGMKYQITEWNQRAATLFSPAFLPFNADLNLLAPPMVSPEFPFFQLGPASIGPPPVGHQTVESIAGLIPCLPAVLAAWLWPLWLRRAGPLEWTGLCLAIQAALNAAVVLCFAVATVRYQWDFLPMLLVSVALAWLRLLETFSRRRLGRGLVTAALFATVVYSVALNLAIGLTGYYDWFKVRNPVAYQAVEDAFLPVQRLWLSLGSNRYGRATIEMRFPANRQEGEQPEVLLAAGGVYRHDVVCVRYTADERAIFRFHHRGTKPVRSLPVRLTRSTPHVVEIEMGSLIPVNARVLARLFPEASASDRSERFSLRVDGQEVLDGRFDFIPSMPQLVTVGIDRIGNDQCTVPFSGIINWVRRSLSPEERP